MNEKSNFEIDFSELNVFFCLMQHFCFITWFDKILKIIKDRFEVI